MRALLCKLTGHLKAVKEWQEHSQRTMLHLYFTDCRSLTGHLPCEKISEKYHPAGVEIKWIDSGRQLAARLFDQEYEA